MPFAKYRAHWPAYIFNNNFKSFVMRTPKSNMKFNSVINIAISWRLIESVRFLNIKFNLNEFDIKLRSDRKYSVFKERTLFRVMKILYYKGIVTTPKLSFFSGLWYRIGPPWFLFCIRKTVMILVSTCSIFYFSSPPPIILYPRRIGTNVAGLFLLFNGVFIRS